MIAKSMPLIFASAALASAVLFAAGCSTSRVSADSPPAARAIRLATVETAPPPEEAKYSAILTPDSQVDLAFRVSGYVVELYETRAGDGRVRPLEPGSQVSAGTVLARIRPSDYQAVVDKAHGAQEEADATIHSAESQLVQAQAQLAQAELDFGRISALWEQESTTKPAYDASKARLDIARAAVEGARSSIAAAQKRNDSAMAQTREAQIALEDTELRAPFDAVVLERRVERGTLASAGAPAFTLADLSTLRARFNVPDFALAGFRPGQSLKLSVMAFPDEGFSGRILSLAEAADPKARSFEIEVSIRNPGLKLRSGMIASVHAGVSGSGTNQLLIPSTALVHDPAANKYLVYTIEQNSGRTVAKPIPVQPGPLAGNQVVVLSGIQPGQKIVVTGADLLQPGDPVREVE
jgi:multidrug efflux pump subunit AcrA (membrane-fusion protein)